MSTARARELRKSMGTPEAIMWNALRELRPLGFHFRRQVPLGPYYADFACHGAKLVIEVDGDTHGSTSAMSYDARRDVFIASEGYKVLRVPNHEVMQNLEGVVTQILVELGEISSVTAPPTLSPSPQGGGRR